MCIRDSMMINLFKKIKSNSPILLIEHDMDAVFALADRVSVINYGKIVATGTVDEIRKNTGCSFVLIAHHNKHDGDTEPILGKNIITGGKTLTNYVSNVFQIGTSSMGADIRRGKITKIRDHYSDLLNEPLRLDWNPESCIFEYKGTIVNEKIHCEEYKKRWE